MSSRYMVPLIWCALIAIYSTICAATVAAEPAPVEQIYYKVPYLAVVSASPRDKFVRILGHTATICPTDYPDGFSIMCEPGFWAQFGKFTVNWEYLRTERKLPFFIAGNYGGHIMPWRTYSDQSDVRCTMDDGVVAESSLTFKCYTQAKVNV